MIVKYLDDYWLYDGQRNGELLILKHLSTGETVEAAPRDVAIASGLNGQPQSEYDKLVRKHKNNLRAVLQEIESGTML